MNREEKALKDWQKKYFVKAYQYKDKKTKEYIAMSSGGREIRRQMIPFPTVPIAECQQGNRGNKRWQIRDKEGMWRDVHEDGGKYPSDIRTI